MCDKVISETSPFVSPIITRSPNSKGLFVTTIIHAAIPVIGLCRAQPNAAEKNPTPIPIPAHEFAYDEKAMLTRKIRNTYFITFVNISRLDSCFFVFIFFLR